jgi:hypothetical protein
MPVKIGHLDPLDEETGWKARLINLGYYEGCLADPDGTRFQYAIEEFQCDQDVKVSGKLDDSTKAKLKQVHGC